MSSLDFLEYAIYCNVENAYANVWAYAPPTTCPHNIAHSVNHDSVYLVTADTENLFHYQSDSTAARGTVMSVSQTGKGVAGFGMPTKFTFDTKTAAFCDCVQINATQSVLVYSNSLASTANLGYAVVVTTDGTTVTYGTPVLFSGTQTVLQSLSIAMMDATTVLIGWKGASNGYYVIGVASGSGGAGTLTFSAPAVFAAGSVGDILGSIKVLAFGNYMVFIYRNAANSNRGTVLIGSYTTLAGILTVVVFISAIVFSTTAIAPQQYALDAQVLDSTRFVIFFDAAGMKAVICTVAGLTVLATVTAGIVTAVIDAANVGTGRDMCCVITGTNQGMMLYRRTVDNFTQGRVCPFTTTGSATAAVSQAITIGSSQNFTTASSTQNPHACHVGGGKVAVQYINGGDGSSLAAAVLTQSGMTIFVNTTDYIFSNGGMYITSVLCNGAILVFYRDAAYYSQGVCNLYKVVSVASVFSETKGRQPVGILTADTVTDAVAEVQISGTIQAFSGLVIGRTYYAHADGTISLSYIPKDNSYVPVKIGTAVRTTILNIDTS